MKRGTAITISIVVSLLFAVFFIYPAGMIVKQAFEGTRADGSHFFTLDFIVSVFRNPIYREGLWNAFALGITSTLATLAIAIAICEFSFACLEIAYSFCVNLVSAKPLSAAIPFAALVGRCMILALVLWHVRLSRADPVERRGGRGAILRARREPLLPQHELVEIEAAVDAHL